MPNKSHDKHRGLALGHVKAACQKHGLDPATLQADLDHFFKGPTAARLFELAEKGDPDAVKEGNKWLKASLSAMVGLIDHFAEGAATMPPELAGVKADLEDAIGRLG